MDCPAVLEGRDAASGCYDQLSSPITALDLVLLEDITLALVPRPGPEINSRARLWVSPRLRHLAHCWLTNQRLSLFCMSRLETPRAGSGPPPRGVL